MARAPAKKAGNSKAKEPPPRRQPVFDLAALMKPIKGESRTGESLRYEGTYDAVRKARSEDDENLPRGIWETTPKRANWAEVEKLCLTALRDRSKDLQLAIWLVEAAFMRHGLGGLADSLAVLNGLMENFWDDLHPHMPEDEPEFRAAPIEWLSDHLAVRLRLMPLNRPREDSGRPFCLSDWQRGGRAGPEDEAEAEGEGRPPQRSRKQMLAAAAAEPPEHFRDMVLDIAEVGQQLERMEGLIDAGFRSVDAPGMHATREVLEELDRLARRILEGSNSMHLLQGDAEEAPADEAVDTPAAAPATAKGRQGGDAPQGDKPLARKAKPQAVSTSGSGPIGSRLEAYQRLEEAAAWLMENEPHSPTPYLIQRAVSWRDKSLVELLSELVPDDDYRGFLQSLFGSGRPRPSEGIDNEESEDWKDSDDEH